MPQDERLAQSGTVMPGKESRRCIVAWTPQQAGTNLITVCANGTPLIGSPFAVECRPGKPCCFPCCIPPRSSLSYKRRSLCVHTCTHVWNSGSTDATTSVLLGAGLRAARVFDTAEFMIEARDRTGTPVAKVPLLFEKY